ncbi:unnamed protein product [Camellia sinensis]
MAAMAALQSSFTSFSLSSNSFLGQRLSSPSLRKGEKVASYLNGCCIFLVGMMGSGKTTVSKNPTCIQNVALEYIRRKSHVSDTIEGVEEGKFEKEVVMPPN